MEKTLYKKVRLERPPEGPCEILNVFDNEAQGWTLVEWSISPDWWAEDNKKGNRLYSVTAKFRR